MKAIAAMAENRVIGQGSKIPWHLPEDFKWFKQTTMGHTLLMGRKTFESIGRPLPGRTTLVLSRSEVNYPGTTRVSDWRNIPTNLIQGDLFVAGGAEVYAQTLPHCTELFLTKVKQHPEGNVLFPAFEYLFPNMEVIRDTDDFTICHYTK